MAAHIWKHIFLHKIVLFLQGFSGYTKVRIDWLLLSFKMRKSASRSVSINRLNNKRSVSNAGIFMLLSLHTFLFSVLYYGISFQNLYARALDTVWANVIKLSDLRARYGVSGP